MLHSNDVWTVGDWEDIETSLLEEIANGELTTMTTIPQQLIDIVDQREPLEEETQDLTPRIEDIESDDTAPLEKELIPALKAINDIWYCSYCTQCNIENGVAYAVYHSRSIDWTC